MMHLNKCVMGGRCLGDITNSSWLSMILGTFICFPYCMDASHPQQLKTPLFLSNSSNDKIKDIHINQI
jgi:hypothetical protein